MDRINVSGNSNKEGRKNKKNENGFKQREEDLERIIRLGYMLELKRKFFY